MNNNTFIQPNIKLLLVVSAISFALYACKNEDKKTIAFIHQPMIGDVYTIKDYDSYFFKNDGTLKQNEKDIYTLWEVDSITIDSIVYFKTMNKGVGNKNDVQNLKKVGLYDSKVREVRDIENLLEMYKKGYISTIERIGNENAE